MGLFDLLGGLLDLARGFLDLARGFLGGLFDRLDDGRRCRVGIVVARDGDQAQGEHAADQYLLHGVPSL